MLGLALAGPQARGIADADSDDSETTSVSTKQAGPSNGPSKRATHSTSATRSSDTHDRKTVAPPSRPERSAASARTAKVLAATQATPTPTSAAVTRKQRAVITETAPAAGVMTASGATSKTAPLLTGNALPTTADPITDFFDGVALLIRRTFFNQAPTVSPVQLTGQDGGVITGTFGAIDPEGDPIEYSLYNFWSDDGQPDYGHVDFNPDGTFTYTPGANFDETDTITVVATDTGFHINLLDLFRPPGTQTSFAVTQVLPPPPPPPPCSGAECVGFTFNYGAGAELWSDDARAALEAAAHLLASYLVVTTPVNLTYTVTGQYEPDAGYLATGGSSYYDTKGFSESVVQHKIISGVDWDGDSADGVVNWNWAYEFSLDGTFQSGPFGNYQYDFQTVAMHELIHSLGFSSHVDGPGANTSDAYTSFDSFIVTSSGAHPFNADGTWNSAYDQNLTGADGGLYFGGSHAVAANGGMLVPLFTPGDFRSSSVTHLDPEGPPNVMNAGVPPGVAYLPSAVDLAILQDLGYTVVSPLPGARSAAPLPASVLPATGPLVSL